MSEINLYKQKQEGNMDIEIFGNDEAIISGNLSYWFRNRLFPEIFGRYLNKGYAPLKDTYMNRFYHKDAVFMYRGNSVLVFKANITKKFIYQLVDEYARIFKIKPFIKGFKIKEHYNCFNMGKRTEKVRNMSTSNLKRFIRRLERHHEDGGFGGHIELKIAKKELISRDWDILDYQTTTEDYKFNNSPEFIIKTQKQIKKEKECMFNMHSMRDGIMGNYASLNYRIMPNLYRLGHKTIKIKKAYSNGGDRNLEEYLADTPDYIKRYKVRI